MQAKMTAEQIIEYVSEWIERERVYEVRAFERKEIELWNDCNRRIFTLNLLLNNIAG